MIGYDPSYLNETETLLEEFHKIQKYLFENPIYKIYQANVDYVTSVNEYYITDVTTRSGDMLGVGDVVLFRNVYYGVITEINEDTQMFTIAEGISFRGARGLQGETGPVGPVGPVGPTGASGLSIYLYDGTITSTTTTATTTQVEVPTGRTLQVYDILFSTYETTYGAMAEVTEIHDTGLRVDYIGQVAGASGGGSMPTYMDIGANIEGVGYSDDFGISYVSQGNELSDDNDVMVECFQNIRIPITAGEGIEFVENENHTVSINATGGSGGSGGVSDVQINGTSIVANGVANIPYASASAYGVVSTGEQTFEGAKRFNRKVTLWNASMSMGYDIGGPLSERTLKIVPTTTANCKYFLAQNSSGKGLLFDPSASTVEGLRTFKYFTNAYTSLLPLWSGTLMSMPSTWSTGTSGSVTLANNGLYEVKITKTFGEYDTDIIGLINFAKDGTKGAISTTMSFIGTSGLTTGFIVVDPTGVMTFVDTMSDEGDTSVTLSYRKIGIS